MEEDIWLEELETALNDECKNIKMENDGEEDSIDEMSDIARPSVWANSLGVEDVDSKMDNFDDIFDLPEQQTLREDCSEFVSKLGNKDEDKISVLSDLESIITCYCKGSSKQKSYEKSNGWIDLLLPLLTLKLPRSSTYNMFEAICNRFIPKHADAFHLLRLLILYHDPQLCNFMDSKKVTPELYAVMWFRSLFSSCCSLPVILSMWDIYFQKEDPFFVFFLSLVIVINARESILSLKDEAKSKIVEIVSTLPCSLNVEDVSDFCALAQFYSNRTPSSFKQELLPYLFSEDSRSMKGSCTTVSQALCLPVSVAELTTVQNNVSRKMQKFQCNGQSSGDSDDQQDGDLDSVQFFLIDCRPAEQYNAGHPFTAFHLDCELMLKEPNSFSTAVQGLLSCQRQALAVGSDAGGEHLCFLGYGDLAEDQCTYMIVASFLKKHTQYVSMVTGGYKAFHTFLGDCVDSYLRDHNPNLCSECVQNRQKPNISSLNKKGSRFSLTGNSYVGSSASSLDSNVSDTFSKLISDIGNVVDKIKGTEMKEKFYEYISTPSGDIKQQKHISSVDKTCKLYRNTSSVFSNSEEAESEDSAKASEETRPKPVKLSTMLKNSEVLLKAECEEVDENKMLHSGYLLMTKSKLIVLRCLEENESYGIISEVIPLRTIVRITSKRKKPEFVTFHCNESSDDEEVRFKFLIADSAEVTAKIRDQVNEAHKSKEGGQG